MAAWRPAKSLDVLLAELKARFPLRDKESDGAIGNAEHAARKSDHNPDANGVVRARDYDEDLDGPGHPTGEKEMAVVAEHIRQLGADGDPRLVGGAANGYVIYERRIAGAGKGWAWRAYTGTNAHEHHMHVSVCSNPAGYDSTASWGIASLFQEDNDMLTPDDKKWLTDLVYNIVKGFNEQTIAAVKAHADDPSKGGGAGQVDIDELEADLEKVAANVADIRKHFAA